MQITNLKSVIGKLNTDYNKDVVPIHNQSKAIAKSIRKHIEILTYELENIDHDIICNVDIKNITSKLNNDIESLKNDLLEKDLALEISKQKILETTNLLNV